jgi:hypothetical protein
MNMFVTTRLSNSQVWLKLPTTEVCTELPTQNIACFISESWTLTATITLTFDHLVLVRLVREFPKVGI